MVARVAGVITDITRKNSRLNKLGRFKQVDNIERCVFVSSKFNDPNLQDSSHLLSKIRIVNKDKIGINISVGTCFEVYAFKYSSVAT